MVGSGKTKLYFAIAHAYAILLLLFFAQIINHDFEILFYVLSFFDLLALILFLFLHMHSKRKENTKTATSNLHQFINSNE
jgi:hypothetical protein